VFGWSNDARPFAARTRAGCAVAATASCDAEGLLIEDFGLTDNLMIDAAIAASGGVLVCAAIATDSRWQDLAAFEACVAAAAKACSARP
jgi:hypothetical protein